MVLVVLGPSRVWLSGPTIFSTQWFHLSDSSFRVHVALERVMSYCVVRSIQLVTVTVTVSTAAS